MVENWTDEMADEYLSSTPTQWVTDTVNAVESGQYHSLLAYVNLHKLHKVLSEAMEQIKAQAIAEAQKYGKTFQFHGCEIQNKSAAGRFVFKGIPEWQEQQFKLKQVEEKYKNAWKAREKGMHTITDDGEIIDLSGMEYVPGAETIAVKLL